MPKPEAEKTANEFEERVRKLKLWTMTKEDAVKIVDDWMDDDHELRIPGNDWGLKLSAALHLLITESN